MIAIAFILGIFAVICTTVVCAFRLTHRALDQIEYDEGHPVNSIDAPVDVIGLDPERVYCPLCDRKTPAWHGKLADGSIWRKCVECAGDPDTARWKRRSGRKDAYL